MIDAERIDVLKSIRNNKLYLKRSKISRILISCIEVFIIGIIPLSSIIITLKNIRLFNQGYSMYIVIANLAALVLGFLLFKLFTGGRKLKRIPGKNLIENRAYLLKIFQSLKWEIHDNENNLIIALPNWKTQVTVILENKDVLLNTIRFGRSQTQGMFDEGLYEFINEKLNIYVTTDGDDSENAI
ncbi:hypothetical protein [Pedobacter punctiformis]|uniref:Uncharacterized protein n=1 Tax=Pedobacter punctiformis TaxID=3004097 RepID=A0ABT4LDT9_9SPHI|nr:hypothetical protein [Pedobacter sp. HCMS5-2]MCZ4245009.1 hypothetical protein [Pedobacter sp. HCMS5-2]